MTKFQMCAVQYVIKLIYRHVVYIMTAVKDETGKISFLVPITIKAIIDILGLPKETQNSIRGVKSTKNAQKNEYSFARSNSTSIQIYYIVICFSRSPVNLYR